MSFGDDQKDPARRRDEQPDHLDPGGPHLTPDLPPAAEAPELPGAVRPRPEDNPAGRQAELPPPYNGTWSATGSATGSAAT
jgi:hypothetical protein